MSQTAANQPVSYNRAGLHWRRRMIHWSINAIGFRFLVRFQISGEEHIPDTGPTILMMNHIGAIDPVVCMGAVRNRWVIPMTKVENLRNPIFGAFVKLWGAFTVDRGAVDRRALRIAIELLQAGEMILIAPEGTRHPEGLAEPKDGFVYLATKANALILPAALTGTQATGKSWRRLRRPDVRLNFGRPFRFKTVPGQRVPRDQLTQMAREAMYQLALAQPDERLRGVFKDMDALTDETLEFDGRGE